MTTFQEPQRSTTSPDPPSWYRVRLPLAYKVTSKRGPLQGFAQTRKMSSKDIVFAPVDGLEPGTIAELVIEWPPCLDDDHLQLVLHVIITGTEDGGAEACILSYHFRAAQPAQAEKRAESAGAG